jgi:AraC-like DNA-binding protein
MNFFFLPVNPLLNPYISAYSYMEIDTQNQFLEMSMLPTGSAVLMISLAESRGNIREHASVRSVPRISFTGQFGSAVQAGLSGHIKAVYIAFKPWGAYHLLDIDQHHLKDLSLDFLEVDKQVFQSIEPQLLECASAADVINLIEPVFLKRLMQNKNSDFKKRLMYVSQKIMIPSSDPMLIKKICHEVGFSKSTLERNMSKVVGMPPKQFQRIMRFHALITYLKSNPGTMDWNDLVHQFGYFDQSHFIKDFKLLGGKTPSSFSVQEILLSDLVRNIF